MNRRAFIGSTVLATLVAGVSAGVAFFNAPATGACCAGCDDTCQCCTGGECLCAACGCECSGHENAVCDSCCGQACSEAAARPAAKACCDAN